MLMDPVPSISKVHSLLTQQERQMQIGLIEPHVLVNATDGNYIEGSAS